MQVPSGCPSLELARRLSCRRAGAETGAGGRASDIADREASGRLMMANPIGPPPGVIFSRSRGTMVGVPSLLVGARVRGRVMVRTAFLRRQAASCLRLSQTCTDPVAAEELRLRAAEFFRRASEAEIEQRRPPSAEQS